MLREPIATRRRRIAGNAAVAILVATAAFAAWAAQPPIATQAAGAHGDEPVASMQIKPDPSFVGEIRMQPPKYPKEALDAGVGGTVNLIIDLAADGRITGVSVENPEETDPRFANAAAKAAWDWKFKPQIKDGYVVSDGTTALGGDNRAGVAEILEAVREVREHNLPHGDLKLIFSVAEEEGLLGAQRLDPKHLEGVDFGFAVDVFEADQLYTQGRHWLINGEQPGQVDLRDRHVDGGATKLEIQVVEP